MRIVYSRPRWLGIAWALCLWVSFSLGQERFSEPKSITGIENLRQVAPGLLSGSQPQGDAAFEELASRGVKVLVSVDGSAPQIEAAHKHGLRYIHIPIGYNQIDPQERADLVQAVKTVGGPVLVHCHHGQHRGPAAAAYCGMAMGKLSATQAVDFLRVAGTRSDYTGLWDAVRKFVPPTVPAGPLVEVAEVEPLTAAMVRIDHLWSGIDQRAQTNQIVDWEAFTRESLLLNEEFRELARTSPSKDKKFNAKLRAAILTAEELHGSSGQHNPTALKIAAQKVQQGCVDCHAQYRDQ